MRVTKRHREVFALLDEDLTIEIKRVTDWLMWYARLVPVRIKVERLDEDGTIWAREPAGFINVIKYEDVKS